MSEHFDAPPEEIIDFIRSQTGPVSELPDKFPPHTCMRLRELPDHHVLVAGYAENADGEGCLLLIHGADSELPGMKIIDVSPDADAWIRCGCGEWEHATEKQQIETMIHVDQLNALNSDDDINETY